MIPTVGRSVHYQLLEMDVAEIAQKNGRVAVEGEETPIPFRANPHEVGQICAATIVKVWGEGEGSAVNLQIHVDGNFTLWRTSVSQAVAENDQPNFGRWSEPPRV